ncbi:MAG: calcium-binding protein [Methylococcales bacterium]|nr:calcium-binding protein [Methylococcales bacterium]
MPLLAKVSVFHKINETTGSDRLLGSNVDDSFDIVSGQDILTGGPGSDDFSISSTNVVIKDLGLGGDLLHVSNGASVNAILGDHFIADSASNNDGLATLTDNGSFDVDLHLASGVNGFTVNAAKSISGVSLVGGSHVDNITGGKGADTIDGGADNDSIVAGDGNDSLLGGLGNDNLSAGKGDDTLSGGAGNNTLTGGVGNDTFIVSATAVDSITDLGLGDVIQNALGGQVTAITPKLWVASAGVVNNGTLIINALDSVDLAAITGSGEVTVNFNGTKAIKLTGGTQITRLNGGAGKDTLTAGSGDSTLSGGAGDDTYVINSANVTIIEGTDVGLKGDLVKSSVDFTLSANVEQLTLLGTTAHLATGNALNNTLTANNAGDTLDGGLGNDKFFGGAGNDTFIIDSTADTVTDRLGGIDTIQSSVSYVLPTNIENLVLTGSTAINGTGNRLANSLTGNDGNNILTAGTGDSTIYGGLGNDTIIGSKGNNILNGGAGDDIITAHVRGQGANIIDGGLGNDTITGGAGVNTLTGGEGADTFVFVKGNGATTITDFVSGVDHIQINPLVLRGLGTNTDVNSNTFVANTTGSPVNTLQHFIYNTTNGTLYFDADGTGLRSSAIAIEVLGTATHPTLTVNDIWVG